MANKLTENGAKDLIDQVEKRNLEGRMTLPSFPCKIKRYLNPRGKKQAQSLPKVVKEYGGLPIEIPLIDF